MEGKFHKDRDDGVLADALSRIDKRASGLDQWQNAGASPVMEMTPSARRWKKIKWPLLAAAVIALLATVGIITYSALVKRSINASLKTAMQASSLDTIKGHNESIAILDELFDDHPSNREVALEWAWESLVLALVHDRPIKNEEALSEFLGQLDPQTEEAREVALQAAYMLDKAKASEAAEYIEKRLGDFSSPPVYMTFIYGLALYELDNVADALSNLVIAAQVDQAPIYIPAALLRIYLEQGKNEEASVLVQSILKKSPSHAQTLLSSISIALDSEPEQTESGLNKLKNIYSAVKPRLKDAAESLKAFGDYISGRLMLAGGNITEANTVLRTASEKDPARVPEALWHARVSAMTGDHENALSVLQKATRDRVRHRILPLRFENELALHRIKAAASTLENIRGMGLSDPPDSLLSLLTLQQGYTENAYKMNMDFLSPDMDTDEAAQTVLHLMRTGKADKARKLLRKFPYKRYKKPHRCIEGLKAWLGNKIIRANYLFKDSAAEELCSARVFLEFGIGSIPPEELLKSVSDWQNRDVDLSYEFLLARLTRRIKGRQAAIEKLNAIMKHKPDSPVLLVDLAGEYLELGVPEKAREIAEGVREPVYWASTARAIEAKALYGMEKESEAIEMLETSLKTDPESPALLAELARIRLRNKEYVRAAAAAEKALEHPSHLLSEALTAGAIALNSLGERSDADTMLRTGRRVAWRNVGPGEQHQMSIELMRLNLRRGGKFISRSVDESRRIQMRNLFSAVYYYYYGITLERQEADGIKYYKKAVELDPAYAPPYFRLAAMDRLNAENRRIFGLIFPDRKLK